MRAIVKNNVLLSRKVRYGIEEGGERYETLGVFLREGTGYQGTLFGSQSVSWIIRLSLSMVKLNLKNLELLWWI